MHLKDPQVSCTLQCYSVYTIQHYTPTLCSAAGRPEAADSLDSKAIRLAWRHSPLFTTVSESLW